MTNYVKISFPLEQDEGGYPPEENETIWAIKLSDSRYKIDNIPFYAPLVSDGDVVSVYLRNDELVFKEIIEYSENCTVQVIMYHKNEEKRIRNNIIRLGGRIEGSGTEGFFALSVNKELYKGIKVFLNQESGIGNLDYQESSLR